MMTTLIAICILSATSLLVLGNLRSVAQDILHTLNLAAARTMHGNATRAKLAFGALWFLIFSLSYM